RRRRSSRRPARAVCARVPPRVCPACIWPARGPIPGGPRRWKAPCAAVSPPPAAPSRPSAARSPRRPPPDRFAPPGRQRPVGSVPLARSPPMSVSIAQPLVSPAARALERGRDRLLALQTEAGWWKAELETNVTMEAEDLLLREFLGRRDETLLRETAAWIRSKQGDEGGWSIAYGAPPDLSATIEAWTALRVAGDPPDAAHMRRAAELVRDLGGIEASRVFTRIWLALFGAWPW